MKKAVIKLRWRKIRSEQEVIGKHLLKGDVFTDLLKGTSLAKSAGRSPPGRSSSLPIVLAKAMGRDLACSGAAREPAGLESREPAEGQRGGGSAKQEVSLGGSDPRLQREIQTWSISAYAQHASSIFFFLNLFIFLWSVIVLQSCVHFRCTPI